MSAPGSLPLAVLRALALQHARPGLKLVFDDATSRSAPAVHVQGLGAPDELVTALLRDAYVGARVRLAASSRSGNLRLAHDNALIELEAQPVPAAAARRRAD